MNPSILFSLWLTILFVFSYLIFDFEISINLFIVYVTTIFSSCLGFLLSLKRENKTNLIKINSISLDTKKFFVVTSIIWCYSQFHILSGMFQFFDFSNPKLTKDLITQSFFESEGVGFNDSGKGLSSIINTILYVIGFPSIFIGSYYLTIKKYRGLIPLLMGSLTSLISFSRFHMFIYLSLTIFSFFFFKKINKQEIKLKKSLIVILTLVLILFGIPSILRSDDIDISLVNYLGPYIFGGFAAFNEWVKLGLTKNFFIGNFNGTSFYTLKTWISYTGFVNPPSNLHYEFTEFSNGKTTNVYTLFRPLIEDFGFSLTLILLFIFNLFSGITYRLAYFQNKIELLPILAFQFTFTIFLFYTSIFSDFRIFLGCLFSVFIIKKIVKQSK
jgi:oligosaccharide repeat unit polymerase